MWWKQKKFELYIQPKCDKNTTVVYTTVAKLPLDSVYTTVVLLSQDEAEKQYDKKTTYYCKNTIVTKYAGW